MELGGHHQPRNTTIPSLGVQSEPRFLPYGVPLTVGTARLCPGRGGGVPHQGTGMAWTRRRRFADLQHLDPTDPTAAPAPGDGGTQPYACTSTSSVSAEDGAGRDPEPPHPSLAVPANASGSRHVSTPLSCCQPGQRAHKASGLQTAWCPAGGGDAGMEVPGTSSASTAPGLLSVSHQQVSAAGAVPSSSEMPRCRWMGLKYQPVPERAGKDSMAHRARSTHCWPAGAAPPCPVALGLLTATKSLGPHCSPR